MRQHDTRFTIRDLGQHTAEYDRAGGTLRLSWSGQQTTLNQEEMWRLRDLLFQALPDLSLYQKHAIFRQMLCLAHQLAAAGMPRGAVRHQVGQLRDSLVRACLQDIAARSCLGHLR